MSWSASILERFIAPGVSKFTRAEIPDISGRFPEAPHWLANHFLNSALDGSFTGGLRQVVLGYLRRAHNAFRGYHDARARTLAYLEGLAPDKPRLRDYHDAVSEWEVFALNVSMALDLYRWINKGTGAFAKNDGSKEQRLYSIANQIKHVASCVDSGQCTDADVIPLWITEAGLNSFGIIVSWSEAAEILADIATLADHLQDPLAVVGKRKPQPEVQPPIDSGT